MVTKSSTQALALFLETHSSWEIKNEKLHKTFIFKDFVEAFSFMSQVAIIAEQNDHHPEWFNVYKTVIVDLTTHEVSGISEKDFVLAKAMNKIADYK